MGKRTKLALASDKNFKAIGKGERTSKKVATIEKADGSSFKRRNANQFGRAEGGNDYSESRVNRTDKYAKGSTIKSGGKKKAVKKPKEPKIVRSYFEDEEFEYKKGGNAGSSTFCYSIGGL